MAVPLKGWSKKKYYGDKKMSEHDNKLEIKIQSTRGTKEFEFPKDARVSDAIAKAVSVFGFAPGDTFQLVLAANPGQPLQPERTLASYHTNEDTLLVLTAIGGGV
jgi:hypothetical protein